MKRVAFTIILNGLHHLKHNDYAEYLAKHLDLWIIVEGASKNQGSTAWCKEINERWHNGGHSVDGTVDYLRTFPYHNVKIVYKENISDNRFGWWNNKDEMVNAAIFVFRGCEQFNPCYLWEIDCDEQWTVEQMAEAEHMLDGQQAKTGTFLCNYYVGPDLLAKGEWGEGLKLPYRRLWKWEGEYFKSHEPPELEGGNGKTILLPQRFNHYAYYFERDVRFKDAWYGGHEGIYERWKKLQKETVFPQPISRLIMGPWGKTETKIVRV